MVKKIVNPKNILLWVSGILTIVFACYLLFASWTITVSYIDGVAEKTGQFSISALDIAANNAIAVKLPELFKDGQTIKFEPVASQPAGVLYSIGAILLLVAGLASIGVSFLFKKSKGRKLLYVFIIILAVAGFVVWWIGESPVFDRASPHDGEPAFAGLDEMLRHLETKLGTVYVGLKDYSPEKFFFNRPEFWLIPLAAGSTYLPGMIIPNPRVREPQPEAPVQEQPKEEVPVQEEPKAEEPAVEAPVEAAPAEEPKE